MCYPVGTLCVIAGAVVHGGADVPKLRAVTLTAGSGSRSPGGVYMRCAGGDCSPDSRTLSVATATISVTSRLASIAYVAAAVAH
jgi:hypothetical protein